MFAGIQECFEQQVDKTPDNIALSFEKLRLTYKQLDQSSNQLADFMREAGIGPNKFVGIFMERSIDMIVSILAVIKAGGAYVPLDTEFPASRLEYLIDEIESPIILTQNHLSHKLKQIVKKNKTFSVDSDWHTKISKRSNLRLKSSNSPDDVAYVIYTSGSTGNPKGCLVTHKGILNCLSWEKNYLPMIYTDKMLFKTPFTFDVSVPEVFWPLFSGASLVIARPGGHKDSQYLANVITQSVVTHIQFVPSMLQIFLDEDMEKCKSLKLVTAAGEALSVETVSKFYKNLPEAKLINLYGPAETAGVGCAFWECKPNSQLKKVPLGQPIPNNVIYILNEEYQMVQSGQIGEIYIGGPQVAKGYLKRPELTKERFISDPFSDQPLAIMYKTGDLGRVDSDGLIEFAGRSDYQVKIRGMRVELGEIEAVIAKKLHGENGPLSLLGYYVQNDNVVVESELKNFIKKTLPEYMVPSRLFRLDALPINANGKLDRKVLAERIDEFALETDDDFSQPQNEIEINLAKVWKEVLKIDSLGRNDSFFNVGGDSLAFLSVLHQLRKLGYELNFEDFFSKPTIAGLSELIQSKKNEASQESTLPSLVHQSKLNQKNILSFEQDTYWGGTFERNDSIVSLINNLKGPLNILVFKKCLDTIMQRHSALRSKVSVEGKNVFQITCEPEVEYFFKKDFSHLSEKDVEKAVTDEILTAARTGIDIAHSPAWRCYLFTVKKDEHYFVVCGDHMFFDGISLNILKEDLNELYFSEINVTPSRLSDVTYLYSDFAIWQKQTCKTSHAYEVRKNYWRLFLKDLPQFQLPVDTQSESSKANENHSEVGLYSKSINDAMAGKISQAVKKKNTTLYNVILAAFASSLCKLSQKTDVVFLTIVSIRPPEFQNSIGCFLNSLPIRIQNGNVGLKNIFNQIQSQVIAGYTNLLPLQVFAEALSEKDKKSLMGNKNHKIFFNFNINLSEPLSLTKIMSENVELEIINETINGIYVEFVVLQGK